MRRPKADPHASLGRRFMTGLAVPPFARDPRILCTPETAGLFFPDHNTVEADEEIEAFCWRCPLRAECQAWGDAHSPDWGYWGGLSPAARQEQRVRAAA